MQPEVEQSGSHSLQFVNRKLTAIRITVGNRDYHYLSQNATGPGAGVPESAFTLSSLNRHRDALEIECLFA